jgi:hypothetical protein
VSGPDLGPTQPPAQWIPGSFPEGKSRPRRDADRSLHLVPRSRMSRSYTPLPPSACVACCGTTLTLKWQWDRFLLQVIFFSRVYIIPPWFSFSYITLGMNNRSVGGRTSEISSRPIDTNIINDNHLREKEAFTFKHYVRSNAPTQEQKYNASSVVP